MKVRQKTEIALGLIAMISALANATTASADPNAASNERVPVPSVSSTGQKSGVTAGYVNQLTQTVLPSLVRGPQLEKLKQVFTEGAQLKRAFLNAELTDAQIDQLCNLSDKWVGDTFNLLNSHVSAYAAERFVFRQPNMAMTYTIPGQHAEGYANKWGNTQRALAELLVNLDQLMRDPSIYPEP